MKTLLFQLVLLLKLMTALKEIGRNLNGMGECRLLCG